MSASVSCPHAPGQRGMAVIGALLVVMVATLLVTSLLQRQAADVRAMENALARSQGRLLLASGLDWARRVLLADARRHATTRPDQLWAVPVQDTRISQPGRGQVAVFAGRIHDEQGKFNLRNLARHGSVQGPAYEALQRLLGFLAQPAELASRIAHLMTESQAALTPAGTLRRGPLRPLPLTLDDLAAQAGLDEDRIDVLRPHLTVLPDVTPVNANTASAEVLAAVVPGLSLAQARAVVAQRDRGAWFNDTADFGNRLGNPELRPTPSQITADSNWFLVQGAVSLDRSILTMQALLRRDDRTLPGIIWTQERH
jgi:general secretion pathway protein K